MPPSMAILAADLIVVSAPITTGEGNVVIELNAQRAEAERFILDTETGQLVLEDGRWQRPDGLLSFQRAAVDLGDLSGVLVEARFDGQRLIAEGERLTLVDEDTLRGEDLVLTACRCPLPTWDLTARAVTVELDDVARFTGGWLRVCERRLIPIPAGVVPLAERRSGLLFPVLSLNQDGLIIAQPVYVTLGRSADLTVSPEWRQARGFRGTSSLRYALAPGQGGQLDLSGGEDRSSDLPFRAAGGWQHAWAPGALRTAVDARYQSDDAYLADFGETFVARAVPWIESRAIGGWGPIRAQTDVFQFDEPIQQRPLSAVLSKAHPIGPVGTFGFARLDLFARGDDPVRLTGWTPRGRVGGQLSWGRSAPFSRLDLLADGEVIAWERSSVWGWGQLRADARVPLWGDLGPVRHLAEIGVVGLVGATVGPATLRAPDETTPPSWGAGPSLTSRWLAAGGVPVSIRAQAPWTEAGWQPRLAARLRSGAWTTRLQAELAVQHAEVSWADDRRNAALALIRSEGILQGRGQVQWTLPGVLRPVSVGWRHLYNVETTTTLSAGPSLGYRSPCDCLDVTLSATWSADRPVPDVGFTARVQ